MKVEVAILRPPSLRKAVLKLSVLLLGSCVKVEVAVLGLMGFLDVKSYGNEKDYIKKSYTQSSGTVSKKRWTSRAPGP